MVVVLGWEGRWVLAVAQSWGVRLLVELPKGAAGLVGVVKGV